MAPVSAERIAGAVDDDRPLVSQRETDGAHQTNANAQPAVTSPVKVPESKRNMVPAIVLAGLAAGGIGSGIGFEVVSSSSNSDAAALRTYITARHGTCIPNVASYDAKCPQLQSKLNAYVTFGDAAAVAFVAGAAAAADTALYLLWPSPRPKTAAPSVVRDVRLTPILGSTGNGLLVSGQF